MAGKRRVLRPDPLLALSGQSVALADGCAPAQKLQGHLRKAGEVGRDECQFHPPETRLLNEADSLAHGLEIESSFGVPRPAPGRLYIQPGWHVPEQRPYLGPIPSCPLHAHRLSFAYRVY